jgi:hypothetical protein
MSLISRLRRKIFDHYEIVTTVEANDKICIEVRKHFDIRFWVGFRYTIKNYNLVEVCEVFSLDWNNSAFVDKLVETIIVISTENKITSIQAKLENKMKEHKLLLTTFEKFGFTLINEGGKDFTYAKTVA